MAALEFTDELNDNFRNTMMKRISDRGISRAGSARSEALSRGLGGDPYESSAVGLANQGTDQELNEFDAKLGYNVAGLKRDERLGKQNRGYQVEDRDFAAEEAKKDRDFRETMAWRNQGWQNDRDSTANRRAQQGAMWSTGASLAGTALGAWMGDPAGAQAGGKVGKNIGGWDDDAGSENQYFV